MKWQKARARAGKYCDEFGEKKLSENTIWELKAQLLQMSTLDQNHKLD